MSNSTSLLTLNPGGEYLPPLLAPIADPALSGLMDFTIGPNVLRPALLKPASAAEVIGFIRTGVVVTRDIRPIIKDLRESEYEEQRRAMKLTLPWFSGGIYSKSKCLKDLIQTNFIILDIDDVANIEAKKREALELLDSSLYFVFRSPSNGIKLVYRLRSPIYMPLDYIRTFRYLAKDLAAKLGFKADENAKSQAQACYFSYDPEILVNHDYIPLDWQQDRVKHCDQLEREQAASSQYPVPKNAVDEYQKNWDTAGLIIRYLNSQGFIGYKDWTRCGFALKTAFGEAGLALFELFGENPYYNDDLRHLRKVWNSIPAHNSVGFGSLIWVAKRYGFECETHNP